MCLAYVEVYAVTDIATAPGHISPAFTTDQTNYELFTAYASVQVNVSVNASDALVLIDSTVQPSTVIALVLGQERNITVTVKSAQFDCPNGPAYTLAASQGLCCMLLVACCHDLLTSLIHQ